jgi:probable F420-dependent oxidoreductase
VTGLRLGFGLPVSGSWATPENLTAIARRADELGYHSLWSFQRLLVPAESDWGPMYRSVLDPLTTLGYVAAVTQRARLGVAVVNAPFYSPIVLAKQLSTLDRLSNGRLDTGLGIGWADQEFLATGADRAGRGDRVAEFIDCLRAIWGPDPVQFSSPSYQVPPARVQPKPVQQPTPPVLLGGGADRALRRAGRVADGWISASRFEPEQIGRAVSVIRQGAAEANRNPDSLRIVIRAVIKLTESADSAPDRKILHGSADQIAADLESLSRAGATEAFLDLNFDPEVGSPDADPEQSMDYANRVLDAFAPH